MKLIQVLNEIITEAYKVGRDLESKDKVIMLYQSHHQKVQRNGDDPTPKNLIYNVLNGNYKGGVNTLLIKNSISKNFEVVYKKCETINPENPRIIFIDDFEVGSGIYMEYVVASENAGFNTLKIDILTSGYSDDKNFFKTYKDVPKVDLSEND